MNKYLHWLQRSQINSGLGDFCIVLNEDNNKVQLLHLYPTERFLMYHTIHLQCYSQPRSQDPSPWLRDESRTGAVVRALANNQCGTGSIPSSTSYASWVCWFSTQSTLLWDLFSSNTRFSTLTKSQKFDLICCDLVWCVVSAIVVEQLCPAKFTET